MIFLSEVNYFDKKFEIDGFLVENYLFYKLIYLYLIILYGNCLSLRMHFKIFKFIVLIK